MTPLHADTSFTHQQAQQFYDRFGRRQDTQIFYEDRALQLLVAQSQFEHAHRIVEFGCGTGRLAQQLFQSALSNKAHYIGIDISPEMIQISTQRLRKYRQRAELILSVGDTVLPVSSTSMDRVVATYVLDLLSNSDITGFLQEAHRVLAPSGMLCLASLSQGNSWASKALCQVWSTAAIHKPQWVGGCRPIDLLAVLPTQSWRIIYYKKVTQWAVPTDIVIAVPL